MRRNRSSSKRFILAVVLMLGGAGCAAEQQDDGAVAADDIKNERKISIENFVSHPRIVEVREAVKAVDALPLTRTRKDRLCEQGNGETFRERYVGPGGHVHKVVFAAAGEHGSGTTTLYFSETGKLRFAFEAGGGWVGTTDWKIQKRVYFNEAGERFFEVHREVTWESGKIGPDGAITPTNAPEPDVNTAPYSVPARGSELNLDPAWERDPARAFDGPPSCDQ